jgi:SAM-dependent methyltransferase
VIWPLSENDMQSAEKQCREADLATAHNLRRLNAILDAAPQGTPPDVLFGAVEEDYWLWLHQTGRKLSPVLGEILPGMPDEQWQFQTVGVVGDAALQVGLNASRGFKQIYEEVVGDITACSGILDFGCGWGRILRFFLKDIDPGRLWGIDVVEQNITFCRQAFKWGNFLQNSPFPPTSFADQSFDLIYALSVFSHLSEEAHRKWLDEFRRLLKPGGVFIATTWGREFITRCRETRAQKDLTSVTRHLPSLFPDTEHWLKVYDNGGFCFDTSREAYPYFSDWLGETCIPRGYVLKEWTKQFRYVDYLDAGSRRDVFGQNIIVVRK